MLCWMRFGHSGLFTSIRRLPQKSFGKQSRGQWPDSKARGFPNPDASADSTPQFDGPSVWANDRFEPLAAVPCGDARLGMFWSTLQTWHG
jgi:hypothetical protein